MRLILGVDFLDETNLVISEFPELLQKKKEKKVVLRSSKVKKDNRTTYNFAEPNVQQYFSIKQGHHCKARKKGKSNLPFHL